MTKEMNKVLHFMFSLLNSPYKSLTLWPIGCEHHVHIFVFQ